MWGLPLLCNRRPAHEASRVAASHSTNILRFLLTGDICCPAVQWIHDDIDASLFERSKSR
jgi:hypothetical protein